MSPKQGDMGDRANHRRRLFPRWHGSESGGRHLFTNGTRWNASRSSYDTGKFIKHHLPEGKPQTQGQDCFVGSAIRVYARWPGWGRAIYFADIVGVHTLSLLLSSRVAHDHATDNYTEHNTQTKQVSK